MKWFNLLSSYSNMFPVVVHIVKYVVRRDFASVSVSFAHAIKRSYSLYTDDPKDPSPFTINTPLTMRKDHEASAVVFVLVLFGPPP